eukprot:scaffold110464_cov69-Cyclotella_meneghiniana.AAC.1
MAKSTINLCHMRQCHRLYSSAPQMNHKWVATPLDSTHWISTMENVRGVLGSVAHQTRCKFVRSIVIIQDGCEYLEASLIKRDASSFEALLSFKMVVSTWKRHSSNAMQVVRSIVIIQDGCEYLEASLIKRDASSFEALLLFKMVVSTWKRHSSNAMQVRSKHCYHLRWV